MPCTPFAGGMICTSGRRRKAEPCFVRDCRQPAHYLCDWIVGRPKGPLVDGSLGPIRCSRSCCRAHSKHVDQGKDLCLEHVIAARKVGAIR